MDVTIKERIEGYINSSKVFLFMKGTPATPMCGFSAQVATVLQQLGADFDSFNVLDDEDIRQGIKEYADWPTIPQLYVNGEFVGGCDIITEMFQNGELESLVKQ